MNYYGKKSIKVYITATYLKPIQDYNIPRRNWILWDLEDIQLCKNIKEEGIINKLEKKHGNEIIDIIKDYSFTNIIDEYSKYPELHILTQEIKPDTLREIINQTIDTNLNYGWSSKGCFLLKEGMNNGKKIIKTEFQNENENLKIWYRIFGKRNSIGIPDKDYPDDIVFMKRIERICKNSINGSRFIGEGEFSNEPMIIMSFLPQDNINEISIATINLLEKYNVIPDFELISINSKKTNNPKKAIEDARIKARNNGKKGVLVLSGKQCSLGVSIDNCDIVLLFNNNFKFDMIYQMMFRCMTEGKHKTCGFVIDLNIHRVIDTSIIQYASFIKPDSQPRDAIKYIIQERLIILKRLPVEPRAKTPKKCPVDPGHPVSQKPAKKD